MTQTSWKPQKFYASCYSDDKVIVTSAIEDLSNVTIKDKNGTVVCNFTKINANFEELCPVNVTRIFTIEANGIKKVVKWYEIKEIQSIPSMHD